MKKTLLLCFIHGFKGDETTFGKNFTFVEYLRKHVSQVLPKVDVQAIVYPTYETRGDLGECVTRFNEWLLNKVIDLEVAAGTPSPTVNPSVRVILVGHSMGGIVAAETAIRIAWERPIHESDSEAEDSSQATTTTTTTAAAAGKAPPPPNSLMFPYIQGVLAFDTPFLGISPGVVAHNAEQHYTTAASAIAQITSLTGGLWGGAKLAQAAEQSHSSQKPKIAGALPPAQGKDSAAGKDAGKKDSGGGGGWGKWGTIALAAGAAGAVVAGGAAAYLRREQISQGLGWVTSHLEFVGCLARKEELRRRVVRMVQLNEELGVGFGNFYTRLGQSAASKQVSMVGTVLGKDRTFCVVPSKKDKAGDWRPAVNDKATDEIGAHVSMFEPKNNPNYEKLGNEARDMIATWLHNEWYEGSSID